MDATELARWTRFASKGGIGRCTALQDCVAESERDLMFLKDDEIIVLMQTQAQSQMQGGGSGNGGNTENEGDTYLGYCEGVVGHFRGSHVRFHAKLKRPILTKRASSVASTTSPPPPPPPPNQTASLATSTSTSADMTPTRASASAHPSSRQSTSTSTSTSAFTSTATSNTTPPGLRRPRRTSQSPSSSPSRPHHSGSGSGSGLGSRSRSASRSPSYSPSPSRARVRPHSQGQGQGQGLSILSALARLPPPMEFESGPSTTPITTMTTTTAMAMSPEPLSPTMSTVFVRSPVSSPMSPTSPGMNWSLGLGSPKSPGSPTSSANPGSPINWSLGLGSPGSPTRDRGRGGVGRHERGETVRPLDVGRHGGSLYGSHSQTHAASTSTSDTTSTPHSSNPNPSSNPNSTPTQPSSTDPNSTSTSAPSANSPLLTPSRSRLSRASFSSTNTATTETDDGGFGVGIGLTMLQGLVDGDDSESESESEGWVGGGKGEREREREGRGVGSEESGESEERDADTDGTTLVIPPTTEELMLTPTPIPMRHGTAASGFGSGTEESVRIGTAPLHLGLGFGTQAQMQTSSHGEFVPEASDDAEVKSLASNSASASGSGSRYSDDGEEGEGEGEGDRSFASGSGSATVETATANPNPNLNPNPSSGVDAHSEHHRQNNVNINEQEQQPQHQHQHQHEHDNEYDEDLDPDMDDSTSYYDGASDIYDNYRYSRYSHYSKGSASASAAGSRSSVGWMSVRSGKSGVGARDKERDKEELMADGDALGMGMPLVPAFESRGSFESVRFGAGTGQVYGHGRASTSSSLALSVSSPTAGSFAGSQPAIPLVNPPLTTPGNHTPTISTTSVVTGDDGAERARTSGISLVTSARTSASDMSPALSAFGDVHGPVGANPNASGNTRSTPPAPLNIVKANSYGRRSGSSSGSPGFVQAVGTGAIQSDGAGLLSPTSAAFTREARSPSSATTPNTNLGGVVSPGIVKKPRRPAPLDFSANQGSTTSTVISPSPLLHTNFASPSDSQQSQSPSYQEHDDQEHDNEFTLAGFVPGSMGMTMPISPMSLSAVSVPGSTAASPVMRGGGLPMLGVGMSVGGGAASALRQRLEGMGGAVAAGVVSASAAGGGRGEESTTSVRRRDLSRDAAFRDGPGIGRPIVVDDEGDETIIAAEVEHESFDSGLSVDGEKEGVAEGHDQEVGGQDDGPKSTTTTIYSTPPQVIMTAGTPLTSPQLLPNSPTQPSISMSEKQHLAQLQTAGLLHTTNPSPSPPPSYSPTGSSSGSRPFSHDQVVQRLSSSGVDATLAGKQNADRDRDSRMTMNTVASVDMSVRNSHQVTPPTPTTPGIPGSPAVNPVSPPQTPQAPTHRTSTSAVSSIVSPFPPHPNAPKRHSLLPGRVLGLESQQPPVPTSSPPIPLSPSHPSLSPSATSNQAPPPHQIPIPLTINNNPASPSILNTLRAAAAYRRAGTTTVTIFGRTIVDLASSAGPVVIVWATEPFPPSAPPTPVPPSTVGLGQHQRGPHGMPMRSATFNGASPSGAGPSRPQPSMQAQPSASADSSTQGALGAIPRANFYPQAGTSRPRSRSFSGFTSTTPEVELSPSSGKTAENESGSGSGPLRGASGPGSGSTPSSPASSTKTLPGGNVPAAGPGGSSSSSSGSGSREAQGVPGRGRLGSRAAHSPSPLSLPQNNIIGAGRRPSTAPSSPLSRPPISPRDLPGNPKLESGVVPSSPLVRGSSVPQVSTSLVPASTETGSVAKEPEHIVSKRPSLNLNPPRPSRLGLRNAVSSTSLRPQQPPSPLTGSSIVVPRNRSNSGPDAIKQVEATIITPLTPSAVSASPGTASGATGTGVPSETNSAGTEPLTVRTARTSTSSAQGQSLHQRNVSQQSRYSALERGSIDTDGSHYSDSRSLMTSPPPLTGGSSSSPSSSSQLTRNTSLRSKLSISALRGRSTGDSNRLREKDSLSDFPLSPLTATSPMLHSPVVSLNPETVQVKDTDFEMITPAIRRVSSDPASGDDASLRDGRPSIHSDLRPDSPATLSINTAYSQGQSTAAPSESVNSHRLGPSTGTSSLHLSRNVGEGRSSADAHRAQELKWVSAISSTSSSQARKSKKIRKLILEGVPSSVRFKVWGHVTDAQARRIDGVYAQLVSRGKVKKSDEIIRDAAKWFPEDKHLWQGGNGPLILLLQAYLSMVPDVEYQAGLCIVAGHLLLQSPEEDAFWTFVVIMDTDLRGYFSPRSTQLDADATLLSKLLEASDPQLSRKLIGDLGISAVFLCRNWFLSLFASVLPMHFANRVWDVYLIEGAQFLIRVALTLLLSPSFRTQIMTLHGRDAVIAFLNSPPVSLLPLDADILVQQSLANSVKVKEDDVKKMRQKIASESRRSTQGSGGGSTSGIKRVGSEGSSVNIRHISLPRN